MINANIEAALTGKVHKIEALWSPWVTRYLPTDFDKSLLLP